MTCIEIFSLSLKINISSNDNDKPNQIPESLWKIVKKGLEDDEKNRPSFIQLAKDVKTTTLGIKKKSTNPDTFYSSNPSQFYTT